MNGLILDVVIAVIAVLFIIFGIWRGMYKLIYGLISSLAAIVLAVVLASTVTSFVISRTSLDEMLYNALDEQLQGVIPADLEASSVEIKYSWDDEGEMTIEITNGANTYETVKEYIEEKGTTYSLIFNLIDIDELINSESTISVVGQSTAEENTEFTTTLARVMSAAAIVYILLAIVFVLLWIVLYVVVRLLMFLLKKIVHGTYVGHFLDKLLGMVVGVAFAMIIIWGALAIIRLLGSYTWIIPVNELINASTLTKFLYENNFLYNFLVNSANVQQSIADIFVAFGSSGGTEETTETAETAARFVANVGGKLVF